MSAEIESDEAKRRTLVAIRTLKRKLEAAERQRHAPIAVIGMGCRLPGNVRTPGEFWELLARGGDAVSQTTPADWNVDAFADVLPDLEKNAFLRFKGSVRGSDQFDAPFFRISPREAEALDPQQRLLLEVSWEALESASIVPERLVDSNTGVFVGLSTLDYSQLAGEVTAYTATGNSLSTAAGRISYTLGLRGPSVPVDSACSSSLVAVCLGVQSLRAGDSDLALAGGVNLLLSPVVQLGMGSLGALSPSGKCRAFDAAADGIVRAEGCGMVVLKRLEDAERDGDPVLAVILGAAINHDGRSNGLTAPNGGSQQELIRAALRQAGLAPGDIDYIEAHGTGTPLGDPIEVRALDGVFGADRDSTRPLYIGSLKTNLGHTEAASGVASLLKVILALRHQEIPRTLHFEKPNPHIPWDEIPISVVGQERAWPRESRRRRAGISSFGFGGTNAHLVIEEASEPTSRAANGEPEGNLEVRSGYQVLPVSALTTESLRLQASRYADWIEQSDDAIGDICHAAANHRTHFDQRIAVVADSRDAFVHQLRLISSTVADPVDPRHRKTAFLFAGSVWKDLETHRELLAFSGVYREAFERCFALFEAIVEPDRIDCALPFSGGFALGELWSSWGVRPEYVFGHGTGEYLAAHAAGVLSLESAVKLAVARHRALAAVGESAAIAVGVRPSLLEIALGTSGNVAIAAYNGPESFVLTGPRAAIDAIGVELASLGAVVEHLERPSGAPSPILDESALDAFRKVARETPFARPRVHVVSGASGHVTRPEELADPEHWVKQLRSPLRIDVALQTLRRNGALLLVEQGCRPALVKLAKVALDVDAVAVASLDPRQGARESILDALATLYTHGVAIDWAGVFTGDAHRNVELPAYAFDYKRYWIERPARARTERGDVLHPLLGWRIPVAGVAAIFENKLREPPIGDGRAAALESSQAAARILFGEGTVRVADLTFERSQSPSSASVWQLVVRERAPEGAPFVMSFAVPGGSGSWTEFARGLLQPSKDATDERVDLARLEGACGPGEAWARLEAPAGSDTGYRLDPALVEEALRIVAAVDAASPGRMPAVSLLSIDAAEWHPAPGHPTRVHVRLISTNAATGERVAEVRFLDEQGRVHCALSGVRLAVTFAGDQPADEGLEASEDAYTVAVGQPGRLETLALRSARRRAPGAHEVELQVLATGLNFGDVLTALGLYPGAARALGTDCAGVVERVGADVDPSHVKVGDEVIAFAPGSLGRYVTAQGALVVRKPPELSIADAAAIPTAFLAATYALSRLARVEAGQRVLIHAAAGGVGMAAVQVASLAGAEVFATASPWKWDALRELGVAHTMSSRTLAFADEVMHLTGGRGVDVVLNSLTGDFIEKSLSVVAPGGHFLELGKRGVWTEARVRAAHSSVQYHAVDLGSADPALVRPMFHDIVALLAAGRLRPLPRRTFPIAEVADAFRTMARAKHIGKVVVAHPDRGECLPIAARTDRSRTDVVAVPASGLAAEFAAMAPEQARIQVAELVRTTVGRILGFSDGRSVDRETGFAELGMDSLMAVELRNRLETQIGKRLSATIAFDHPSVVAMTGHLLEVLECAPGPLALASRRSRASQTDKIAIVGVGCRLPGGVATLAQYWELLRDGVDAVTEVPPERWNADLYYDPDPEKSAKTYSRWGAYIDDVKGFDAAFFGISPREAEAMDPQQRILLEVAWEAIENGNLPLPSLRDGRTGVFVGVGENEYRFLATATDISNPYLMAGNMGAVAAGRLSHALGLQGPAVALQTACSSALVAVHLAVQSLRTGECNVALAGGVGLILTVYGHIGRAKLRALAADGRCKTFDHSADGYVPGEGCGLVVLKRLEDAERAGDRILGVIRGSAVNHDGASSGLTVPNGTAQRFVIAEALRDAGAEPRQVDYVEAHGTGTPLGDPIEVQALDAVYAKDRAPDRPLLIGSVKTNIGHLEPAAGIASLLKVALSLGHRQIPRHLHFSHPNELIPWDELSLSVVSEHRAWPPVPSGRRLAGVSAFGMSGTNAHLIMEEPPPPRAATADHQRDHHLLVVSARSARALQAQSTRYADHLLRHTDQALGDICYTAAICRSAFRSRIAVVGRDHAEISASLAAHANDRQAGDWVEGRSSGDRDKVALLFTGQGDQHVGMGRELYESEPRFKDAIRRCDAVIASLLGESIVPVMFEDEPTRKLHRTRFTQPALFALEYALAELWKSWGLVPDVVMGHSFGEYVAACVAGVFTPEDALKLLVHRGALVDDRVAPGAMATVPLPAERVEEVLRALSNEVSIAAYNGADHVVVSGTPEGVRKACDILLRTDSVRAWPLAVSHAFHSPMMDGVLDAFEAFAGTVPMSKPRIALVSNLTGETIGDEVCQPAYWRRHMREPVQFARGARALVDAGVRTFVEIGPQPTLLSMATGANPDESFTFLPSLRKGQDGCRQMLSSLGRLWTKGYPVDLEAAMRPFHATTVELPTYPFEHKSYWLESKEFLAALTADSFDATSNYFYELAWPVLESSGHAHERPRPARWLILADRGGIAERVAAALAERGVEVRLVHHDGAEGAVASGANGDSEDPTEVLCLWGLDRRIDDANSASEAWEASVSICEPIPELVRIYGAKTDKPRVWFVTRGAQAIGDSPVSPSQSVLWGMGRVLSLEKPDLWGGIVDLPAEPAPGEIDLLLAAVHNGVEEDQLAIRDGQIRVARLVARPAAIETSTPPFHADRTYLITGGTGAIGLHIAGWLVARGARQLVLTSRSGPPRARARIDAVAALESAGATVRIVAADVSDEAAMEGVFASLASPLAGVFHVAGIPALTPLPQVDRASLEHFLAPKVKGTWLLHRLTRDLPLDHFVVFSSVSGIWGGFAQGPYAASNHFMDTVVHHRRQLGLPGLSIDWAEWAEGGIGTPESLEYLRRIGVLTMTTPSALAALTRAILLGVRQVTVGNIDWTIFRPVYEAHRRRRLFDLIAVSEVEAPEQANGDTAREIGWFAREIASAPDRDLGGALRSLVHDEASRILRLESRDHLDVGASFVEQGMDSLMGVELRNVLNRALGLNLPTTVVMRHPSVSALSTFLLEGGAVPIVVPGAGEANPGDHSARGPIPWRANGYEEIEI